MSRLLRYLVIWLCCTAASVTAVIITIHFVVGSTRPTAPVARSAPEELTPSPRPTPAASTPPAPSPSPSSARPSTPPPSPTARAPRTPSPTPTRTAPSAPAPSPAGGGAQGCEGGAGVYTVPSEGGKVTVRFGASGVCLISAVPNQGFTVGTRQEAPEKLTVTFSGSRHRSEVTATTVPRSQAGVREVSF